MGRLSMARAWAFRIALTLITLLLLTDALLR